MSDQADLARLYLDVDGVINAVTSTVPAWGWSSHATQRINGYPITWSPDLVAVLNTVAATPGLGIYWLTTWCHDAPAKLAPAIGLHGEEWPVVGHEHWRASRGGLPWWKHRAIVEHLDGFAGPVIWVDDDHGVDPSAVAWLAGQPQILALAPRTSTGLTYDEASIVRRFAHIIREPLSDDDRRYVCISCRRVVDPEDEPGPGQPLRGPDCHRDMVREQS